MATPTKVFYIQGRFLPGYRLEDHEVESKAQAEEMVGTGLFALTEKEANAQAFSTPEATPADDSNVKQPKPAEPDEAPAEAPEEPSPAAETPEEA
jgi:outer membrane biosynthesis protein TonB